MIKFMTILMAAFKEFHFFEVSFHITCFTIYVISYDRSRAIAHEHWDISTTIRLWRLTRNPDPNQTRVPYFRARTISSLARTSGRRAVGFTTGRLRRSFVLLGELHLLPLHLPRASITSRAAVFINACRHVPELISYPDESPVSPSSPHLRR